MIERYIAKAMKMIDFEFSYDGESQEMVVKILLKGKVIKTKRCTLEIQ